METWFRFYSEAAKDAKLQRAARASGVAFGEMLGLWAIVLSMASESPQRGMLLIGTNLPATVDDLSAVYGKDTTTMFEALLKTGLLDKDGDAFFVVNWNKRQYASDSSAERTRAYRARRKEEPIPEQLFPEFDPRDIPVTSSECHSDIIVTPPDTDTEVKSFAIANDASSKPDKVLSPHQELVSAIAEVCVLDVKLRSNATRAGKVAKELREGEYTPAQVRQFKTWWLADKWRRESHATPAPEEIVKFIAQSVQERASPNGNGHAEVQRPDPPAQVKLRELRLKQAAQQPQGVP